jgi:hypothetical protein
MRTARTCLVEADAQLDDRTSKCSCCGLTKYENRKEQQMRIEISAMLRKLDRWIEDENTNERGDRK